MSSISKIKLPNNTTYDINAATVNGYTVATDVPSGAVFTDTKVTQSPATDNANYEVLFSGSADNIAHTEGAKKSAFLKYNPSSHKLYLEEESTSGGLMTITTTSMGTSYLKAEESIFSEVSAGEYALSSNSYIEVAGSDIFHSNTWDGSHYYLKDAIYNVKQSPNDSTDAEYRILFSNTADDTERIEKVQKNSNFSFNPLKSLLSIGRTSSSGGVTTTRYTTMGIPGIDISEYVGSTLWSQLSLRRDDITLSTMWDGTHTSLKDTITYLGSQSAANKVDKAGDTMTGILTNTFKSATFVNSLTQSAITIPDDSNGFGGWICGPTKSGRITIATYSHSTNGNDALYFGYGERGRTDNSYARQMTWNGVTGDLSVTQLISSTNVKANNGYLYSTANGNTVQIGSQNNGWCHFSNSANIPFYFNKTIAFSGDLGTDAYRCGTMFVKGDFNLKNGTSDDTPDLIWLYGNGREKARIWFDNTYTAALGPLYRVYNSSGTNLYNGRLATVGQLGSYLPLSGGTVTGATTFSASGIGVTVNADFYCKSKVRTSYVCRPDDSDSGYVNHVNTSNNAYRPIRASAFTTMSCKHVKTNIEDISDEDAKKLLNLRPVNFDYVEEVGGDTNQVGVLAEDTYEILPKVVSVPEDYVEEDFDITKGIQQPLPSVDYVKFTPYLIKMVQIQQREIDSLKKIIEGRNDL